MSVLEPQARLAVRSVPDLIDLVPFLLGFHPQESLVVIVVDDGRVAVTARVDLAAAAEPDAFAGLVAKLFGRFPDAEGWCFAYTAEPDSGWEVLADCAALLGATRLGRLFLVGPDFCRADHPDGPSWPLPGATSEVAATAALLGLPARASRSDLAAAVTGPPDAEVDELVELFEAQAAAVAGYGRAARRRRLRWLLAKPSPSRDELVQLAVLVAEPDGVVTALRRLTRGTAEAQLQLWTAVVRQCLSDYQYEPLGLLGLAAWQCGDGALAVVCLERLEAVGRADTPLPGILELLNREVLPPAAWESMRAPLLAELAALARQAGRLRAVEGSGEPDGGPDPVGG